MTSTRRFFTSFLLAGLFGISQFSLAKSKHDGGYVSPYADLSVMVLGSGGPTGNNPSGRASAGYLIFHKGKPIILMDAGGGTFKNLSVSGVNIADLDLILISHLHIDHMADLSAFVKAIYFHNRQLQTVRTKPIVVWGPGEKVGPGADKAVFPNTSILQYPAISDYVSGLYNKQTGIERYLNIFASAIHGGMFSFEAHNVSSDISNPTPQVIYDKDGVVVKAIAVNHGPVPALAFRIESNGVSIAYSGDTSSKTDNMIDISKKADMVIYDTAITDTLPNLYPTDVVFKALHTTPTRMGEVCKKAKPRILLLSHLTPVTDPRIDEVKDVVEAQGCDARIKAAEDLNVYNFKGH